MKKHILLLLFSFILLSTACTAEAPISTSTDNAYAPSIVTPSCGGDAPIEGELTDNASPEGLPDENCPLEHVVEESEIPPEPEATPVPDMPPAVHLEGESGAVFETLLGTYTWSNGNLTTEACTLHPLDAVELLPVVQTSAAGHSVILQFDGLHKTGYTVKYWEMGADYDAFTIIEPERDLPRITFDLSTAGKQCVYSVWVEYPEGEAEYLFLVDYNCR